MAMQLRHPSANGNVDVRHDGLAVEDGLRRAVRGVDEVHEAVEHSRREGAAQRIPGDQLDVHGAERARDRDRADDRPVLQDPTRG